MLHLRTMCFIIMHPLYKGNKVILPRKIQNHYLVSVHLLTVVLDSTDHFRESTLPRKCKQL
jgi:hypothetical protein